MPTNFFSNKPYNPYNFVPAVWICTDHFGKWIYADFENLFNLVKQLETGIRVNQLPIRENLSEESEVNNVKSHKVGFDAASSTRNQSFSMNLSFPYWVVLLVTASFFIGQSFLIVGR